MSQLYIFPKDVIQKVEKVKRSARGELEITSLNNIYLNMNYKQASWYEFAFAYGYLTFKEQYEFLLFLIAKATLCSLPHSLYQHL